MEVAFPEQAPHEGEIVIDPDSQRYAAAFGRIRRLRVRRVQKAPTGDWFVVLTNPELPRGRDRFVPLSEYLTRYVPAA